MNEYQWRSGMRALGGAAAPQRDLWPGIAARITQHELSSRGARRSRRIVAWSAAAAIVLGVGVLVLASQLDRSTGANTQAGIAATNANTGAAARSRTALAWAAPTDPTLHAAARELDRASAELQAALENRPDAVFLVSLLNRTTAQRIHLLRQQPTTS